MNTVMLPAWIADKKKVLQAEANPWLLALRQKHWDAFLQRGLPQAKDERFKYADFSHLKNKSFPQLEQPDISHLEEMIHQHKLRLGESILLTMVNGYFAPALSDMHKLPQGVVACSLKTALAQHEALINPHWFDSDSKLYPFASLNTALFQDGLFFYLPEQCQLPAPIHLYFLTTSEKEFMACTKQIIVLGEHSKLTVLEEHFSHSTQPYFVNNATVIAANKSASLQYCKIQNEGSEAVHITQTFVHQAQDSTTTFTYFSTGAAFERNDLAVDLQEAGAQCSAGGFYCLQRENQYIDHHIDIDHSAPHTNSEMLYKGILKSKARAVFNGRLHVKPNAQSIAAYQANHNLLLSNEAEVFSKPELEIYADDVKCKHGATTGELDQDALFYMRARGIPEAEATNILLSGFAEEILQRVEQPGIKLRIQETVNTNE